MKYLHPISLLFTIVLLGCNSKPSEEVLKTEPPRTNQVVLIFDNPVSNGFYTIPDGDGRSQGRTRNGDEIQYIDDQYIPRKASFNLEGKRDTVIIETKRDFLEVQLMYKGVDDLRYIFKNGDTVEIIHQDIKPIAKILNRQEDYSVTNFAMIVRDSIVKDDYRASQIISSPIMISHRYSDSSQYDVVQAWKQITQQATEDLAPEIRAELVLLDDLVKSGKMSQEQFNTHIISIHSDLKRTLSFQKTDEEGVLKPTFNRLINEIENKYPVITNNRQDTLLYLMDYNKAMTSSIALAYNRKVGRMKRESKSAGINIINYARLYDSIRVNDDLSQVEKKIIQYNNVNGILQNGGLFGIESQLIYLTRFNNDFKDSLLMAEIKEKYQIKFQIEDEIRLESVDNELNTFESIVVENTGKVLYIDFWASWCAPCIKEMPSSKLLSSKYSSDEVVFIYISVDRRDKDWRQAIKKNELTTGLHYRITNANNSKGYQDLNIPFIPRYMIYNNDGSLANDNAPRPSEDQLLTTELAKFLSEQK